MENHRHMLAMIQKLQSLKVEKMGQFLCVKKVPFRKFSHICQSYGGFPLSYLELNSNRDVEMVPGYLSAEYLPGVDNKIADEESRATRDHCYWMIHNHECFQSNQQSSGSPRSGHVCLQVDPPTSMLLQLETRSSSKGNRCLRSELEPVQRGMRMPYGAILSTLSKIHRDRAKVILVAPVWRTQPWYPLLL